MSLSDAEKELELIRREKEKRKREVELLQQEEMKRLREIDRSKNRKRKRSLCRKISRRKRL